MVQGLYEDIVTNLYFNARDIWRPSTLETMVGQVVDDLKNDFASTDIRTNCFRANDTLFLL